jgi:hypothetical protein
MEMMFQTMTRKARMKAKSMKLALGLTFSLHVEQPNLTTCLSLQVSERRLAGNPLLGGPAAASALVWISGRRGRCVAGAREAPPRSGDGRTCRR